MDAVNKSLGGKYRKVPFLAGRFGSMTLAVMGISTRSLQKPPPTTISSPNHVPKPAVDWVSPSLCEVLVLLSFYLCLAGTSNDSQHWRVG